MNFILSLVRADRNVIAAAYSTVVLHRVLRVLLRAIEGGHHIALAAAVLFTTHPVHSEAVAGTCHHHHDY